MRHSTLCAHLRHLRGTIRPEVFCGRYHHVHAAWLHALVGLARSIFG